MENASGADPPPSLQQMVEAVTAAVIAAVDCHLAHVGLCPRSEPAPPHDFVTNARPLMTPAPVAPPPPPAGSVAPTTHPTAVPTDNGCPLVTPAYTVPPQPLADSVAPTTHSTAVPLNNTCPIVAPVAVSAYPPPAGPVALTANPTSAPTRTALPSATSFAPVLNGPLTPAPPGERILYGDSSSQVSNTSSPLGLRADFVVNMRRVPRVQPLQFPPSTDSTAATQLLIRSMRDALSEIFDVADPTETVTINSPVWVPGWHAPLLKLTMICTAWSMIAFPNFRKG